MSRPPERSWMPATLIISAARALEANVPVPAAAVAIAAPRRNSLRLTVIVVLLHRPGCRYVTLTIIFFRVDAAAAPRDAIGPAKNLRANPPISPRAFIRRPRIWRGGLRRRRVADATAPCLRVKSGRCAISFLS